MTRQDLYLGITLCCGIGAYELGLRGYLAALSQPLFLHIGLWLTLVIASWHEYHHPFMRHSMACITANTVMFSIAVWCAQLFRHGYLALLPYYSNTPELATLLGPEILGAIQNRAVGYGGCFAATLAIARLCLYDTLQHYSRRALVPTKSKPNTCFHCRAIHSVVQ